MDLMLDGFPLEWLRNLPLPAIGTLLDTVMRVRDRRREIYFWDNAVASQGTAEAMKEHSGKAFGSKVASGNPDALTSF